MLTVSTKMFICFIYIQYVMLENPPKVFTVPEKVPYLRLSVYCISNNVLNMFI